jgi:hypothetical protein
VFEPKDLVQVPTTQWVQMFASIKKLIPMWLVPYRVTAQQLNSYTLETLDGLPLTGVYNSRWLRAFVPRKGTKLATEELVHFETFEGSEELYEDEDLGLVEMGTGLGVTTRASL